MPSQQSSVAPSSSDQPVGAEDASLLDQVARGEIREVLSVLMEREGAAVHRFCLQQLRDGALAEDVVQTVFVQAYRDLPRFTPRSSIRVWLFTIARNRCLDELRRARRWRNLLTWPGTLPDLAGAVAEPEGERHQWQTAFKDCLARLSAQVRECLLLRFSANLSYEEIANVTGGKAGALRVRIARAMPVLRRCLQHKEVEP